MRKNKLINIFAIVLGVLLIAFAIFYLLDSSFGTNLRHVEGRGELTESIENPYNPEMIANI